MRNIRESKKGLVGVIAAGILIALFGGLVLTAVLLVFLPTIIGLILLLVGVFLLARGRMIGGAALLLVGVGLILFL